MSFLIHNNRGSENLYSIIGISILVLLIFVAYSFAGPFFKNMSLKTYSQKLVNYDYQNDTPSPTGAKSIYTKLNTFVRQKKLPIHESQIAVDYDRTRYTVRISYEQTINLVVYKYKWKFEVNKQSMEKGTY